MPIEWFAPVKDGLIERVFKVAAAADDDVELESHLCYGIEPCDMALSVEIENSISTKILQTR